MKGINEEMTVEYAYKVMENLKEALDYVAAKPEKIGQLAGELLENLPDIVEAMVVLTKEEHRPVLIEVLKSMMGVMKSWKKTLY